MARASVDVEYRDLGLSRWRAAWLTAALILTSCSHVPPGSPDYRDGYVAGCSDGYFDAGGPTGQTRWMRDESLFETKADYKSGWQEGYTTCYAEERDHPTMGTIGR